MKRWEKVDWPEKTVEENKNIGTESTGNSSQEGFKHEWFCKEISSKMDGVIGLVFGEASIDKVENSAGDLEYGFLSIRCRSNKTDAFISWPSYLSNDPVIVEYKIDDNKKISQTWGISTNGKTVFAPQPINWLKSLKGAKRLIVRLAPYNKEKQELEFDLNGIDEVIDKVSAVCNWKK